MGKYKESEHEKEPILCPREKCRRKNAPLDTDEFSPRCWKCNTYLNVSPVSVNDEVVVTFDDMHETGAGVGRTEDGYVIMVHGIIPPAKAKVEITEIKPNYAWAEKIESLEIDEEENETDEEEDDDPRLGSRENYWG